jgi:hypothetical protein
MVHVPYRGTGPALTDLLGGQVQVMFASMPSAIEYIRAGTLRALAVTIDAMTMPIDQNDYSVVVKHRAPPPKSWRWEIYRAGRRGSVEQSLVYFHTMAAANWAGREALKQLLDKLHAEQLANPGSVNWS